MARRTVPRREDRRPWGRRVVHALEAAAAYTAFGLVGLLPIRIASSLGGWIGRTIGPRLKVTERARRNLRAAFPENPAAEIERIVRAMWDNIGRTFFEYPHLERLRYGPGPADVEVIGREYADLLRTDGKPGIFFSAHLANWEVSALTAVRLGLPIHLVYREPNNPWMESLFARRNPGDIELIPKGSEGARRMLALLSAGEHLGMLMDQKMSDGIPVTFFGRDAMTAPALAQFALKFRCPVIPAQVERLEGPRFRVTVFPPMPLPASGDRKKDVAAMMAEVNQHIERWVRQRPEQWLWLHNRWPD